ncbi:MAG TPA: glycosyltransferase family 1 protein [Polyangiaceae bacterium]
MLTPRRPRVCLDLTPNETIDRYGGIGRYGYYLLERLLELPEVQNGAIELLALPVSDEPVISAEQALRREVLSRPPLAIELHRNNRRRLSAIQLRRADVDLFHATHALALPRLLGCKLICTIYDLVPIVCPLPQTGYERFREKLDWVARVALADHLIAISERTADDLMGELKVRRSRVTTIYLGVDPLIFNTQGGDDARISRKYDLPERGFLCVSSDHYRKNHRALFDAWCERAAVLPEGLVFVGRALYGTTLREIEQVVRERGLTARFRWLQEVTDDELPAIYRWARGTIAPSLYEGFGMTLIESMACGTPLAVARNGAYEEVAGPAAEYFDARSPAQLAGCLTALSQDEQLHARLSRDGLERAKAFTWRGMAEATLAVYRKLLDASFGTRFPEPLSPRAASEWARAGK